MQSATEFLSVQCGRTFVVPHETMAVPHTTTRRRYNSGKRAGQAEGTRQALIEAALALIGEGKFRASSREITARAGVHHGAINYHFRHERLLYRVIARECWAQVASSLPFGLDSLTADEVRAAVWAVLVGEPRTLS